MNVEEKLQELGETADQVAASLFDQGVTGIRGSLQQCPLSNWVQQTVPHCCFVMTWNHRMQGVYEPDGSQFSAVLPDACVAFVSQFDSGQYRRLTPSDVAEVPF